MPSKKPVPRPVFASKKPVGAKAAQAADSSDESEFESASSEDESVEVVVCSERNVGYEV